jgi:hypothetical protein
MDRKTKGLLAESKTISELITMGCEVYTPFADNGPYDLLTIKENKIYKVSVKCSSVMKNSDTVLITLKTVSRRKENDVKVNKFDSNNIDILAVYVLPLDIVYLIDAKKN